MDPYDREANRDPQPIRALGRFEHEAVAVDPDTGQIYETEDATNPHGLFYRWTPPDCGAAAGQGIAARAGPDRGDARGDAGAHRVRRVVADLCVATEPGTTYAVEWVTVPDRDGDHRSGSAASSTGPGTARRRPARW